MPASPKRFSAVLPLRDDLLFLNVFFPPDRVKRHPERYKGDKNKQVAEMELKARPPLPSAGFNENFREDEDAYARHGIRRHGKPMKISYPV